LFVSFSSRGQAQFVSFETHFQAFPGALFAGSYPLDGMSRRLLYELDGTAVTLFLVGFFWLQ
jgi:hypothetical protein